MSDKPPELVEMTPKQLAAFAGISTDELYDRLNILCRDRRGWVRALLRSKKREDYERLLWMAIKREKPH